jgi:pimeloyl-ACP methyl ester carboxylesterase
MKREVRGQEIGYEDRGQGPAVVLLHPFPFDRQVWDDLVSALAATWRVIAVDTRNFGESAPGPFSIADIADDVGGLMDALGVARATVLGMSMGGYAALAFAARHAARLEALILADTRAAADTPDARAKRDEAIALCHSAGGAAYLDGFLPRLLAPDAPAPLLAAVRARAEERGPRLVAGLEALRDRPDRTAELGGIACRTLVICGERDQVVPVAEMEGIARAIAGARFVPIQAAGHLAHLEAPTEFIRTVSAFLNEAGA